MQIKDTTHLRTYSLAADYLSKVNRNPQAKTGMFTRPYHCIDTRGQLSQSPFSSPLPDSKLTFIEAIYCQAQLIFWDSLINLADMLRRYRFVQQALLPFKSDGWSQVVRPFLYWSVTGLIIGLVLGYIRGFLP